MYIYIKFESDKTKSQQQNTFPSWTPPTNNNPPRVQHPTTCTTPPKIRQLAL